MQRILFLLIFLLPLLTWANHSCVIKDSSEYINLSPFAYHFEDKSDTIPIEDVVHVTWGKLEGTTSFGSNKHIQWLRYSVVNKVGGPIHRILFVPYHHISNLTLYSLIDNELKLIGKQGTKTSYKGKPYKSEGYAFDIYLQPGDSISYFFKLSHINRPLRATTYLMTLEQFRSVNSENSNLFWLWRGVLLFTIITSFILFWFVRLRMFLYYGLLNIGVSMFIGSQVGDLFLVIDIDRLDWVTQLDTTGAMLVNIFFPLFLSVLTPVKERNPNLWKVLYIFIGGVVLFWVIYFIPGVRQTKLIYYTHFYIMIVSGLVFIIQPVLLFKSLLKKDKNAFPLFVVYSLYVFTAFVSVIFPNMGFIDDSPRIHNSLIIGSLIEVVSFMFIMARETMSVYKEHAVLQVRQLEHQREMVFSMVKGQEEERNRVGRELHDLIGANMAIIKQRVNKNDTEFYAIVKQTIESVRTLSHGLITPMVEKDEFVDEIKEMAHLFSSEKIRVNTYFHGWVPIDDSEITTHLYRIAQELLQNATKHSEAENVFFQFIGSADGRVDLMYEDDGVGFDPHANCKGLGMRNVKNRVHLLKGTLNIDSKLGHGTTMVVELPCC